MIGSFRAASPRQCDRGLTCESSSRGVWAPETRSGSSRDPVMTSPSGMCPASTPVIAMRSSDCWRFPRCPGVGGDGRKIFFKGPKAAPWTLANLDVARCQRHRISQWAITSSGCRRTPACRSRDSQSAPTNFCTHPRKVRHLIPGRTNDRRKAKE